MKYLAIRRCLCGGCWAVCDTHFAEAPEARCRRCLCASEVAAAETTPAAGNRDRATVVDGRAVSERLPFARKTPP